MSLRCIKPLQSKYARRDPRLTPCYKIFQEELQTFLTEREAENRPVPDFVKREFDAYLKCGILEYGFLRLHCDSCDIEKIVAFSCKKRGFCPSRWAKRMAESAEHLVENVLPVAPYRQFVVSFPVPLRYWLHTNQQLFAKVHKIISTELSRAYVTAAKTQGCLNPKAGSITYIQRFGSSLKLNLHLHILALDGVFDSKTLINLSGIWNDAELEKLSSRIIAKTLKLLKKEGYIGENEEVVQSPEVDPLFESEESYSAASQASMQDRIAFGKHAGQKVTKVHPGFGFYEENPVAKGPLCIQKNGFSFHCNTAVKALARDKLERLVRYMARGPVSNERLTLLPNNRVRIEFKRPWSDCTAGVSMTYSEFIEKLMALIPPPRRPLTRWNGIFAPASKLRAEISPKPEERKGSYFTEKENSGGEKRKNSSWARLLKRVFKIDVLECECGGKLKPVAALKDFESCKRYLENMGYGHSPPKISPARLAREPLW